MNLDPDQLAGSAPEGVYVHVPFCRRRCDYCDFYSNVLDGSQVEPFINAAVAELAFWADRLDLSAVQTVFIGGGTPTSLPADSLDRLLAAIGEFARRRGTRPDPPTLEFTVEANPATVDLPLARRLRAHGVDRISFGAQSFDDAELRRLGRIHNGADTAESVRVARAAGFENVNLDLMFGVPGQTLAGWRRTLDAAVALGVGHVSCYGLSYEPGTPLARQAAQGCLQPLADEAVVAMYRLAESTLAAAGLEHYEISNWARPSRRCRHNLLYWRNRPWLGIGPSAASYLAGYRFKAPADLARYVAAISAGRPDYQDVERLTGRAAAGEAAMLGLRLREGIDPDEFASRYGLAVDQLDRVYQSPERGIEDLGRRAAGEAIRRHMELGLLAWRDGRLQLTEEALPVADSVLVDFVVADEGRQ